MIAAAHRGRPNRSCVAGQAAHQLTCSRLFLKTTVYGCKQAIKRWSVPEAGCLSATLWSMAASNDPSPSDPPGPSEAFVEQITRTVEPVQDPVDGPLYRCSLTLRDGTLLPCAVLQSKARRVALARKRLDDEREGRTFIGGADPYGVLLSTLVASGNRVSDYDVLLASESPYAVPLPLLAQIRGETFMGWTGWVFRMRDGRLFPYGSPSSRLEFLELPEGYTFADVTQVIKHSFVDPGSGSVASLIPSSPPSVESLIDGSFLPVSYERTKVLRERPYFTCLVDGI